MFTAGATVAWIQMQAGATDGLTANEIIQSIPLDPASLFVYVLLLASIYGIWRGSRPGGPKVPKPPRAPA